MFHFSDDFDEELEDFLSTSVDEKLIQNVKIATPVCSDKEQTSLEILDGDELILSAVENIGIPIHKEADSRSNIAVGEVLKTKLGSELDGISKGFSVENCDRSLEMTSVTRRESLISDFFRNTDSASSSPGFNKHKLMVTSDSPFIQSKVPKLEYERKFPGPAGLIVKKDRNSLSKYSEPSDNGNSKKQLDVSVADDSLFENSSWHQLLEDVNSKSDELKNVINEYSVAAVKRMNIIKHTSRKIPLFAAVILHIDCSLPDPSVILKDPSGEIRGTLHKDIWEKNSHLLSVGSAVLLRQVSVLSIANSRKLYLNITGNNIDTIYTIQTGKSVLITRISSHIGVNFLHDESRVNEKECIKVTTCSSRRNNICSNTTQCDIKCNEKSDQLKSVNDQHVSSISKNLPDVLTACQKDGITENSSSFVSCELDGIDADSIFGDF